MKITIKFIHTTSKQVVLRAAGTLINCPPRPAQQICGIGDKLATPEIPLYRLKRHRQDLGSMDRPTTRAENVLLEGIFGQDPPQNATSTRIIIFSTRVYSSKQLFINNMKSAVIAALIGSAAAFAPAPVAKTTSVSLCVLRLFVGSIAAILGGYIFCSSCGRRFEVPLQDIH